MAQNTDSRLHDRPSTVADLTAMLCRGGLVVESSGESGSISVRSTIQPDGDVTIIVARSILHQAPALTLHLVEIETRIHRIALLVKRTMWVVHGGIGLAVLGGWFAILNIGPTEPNSLAPVAVWIFLSIGSGVAIEFLLRTTLVQKLLSSVLVAGLSRFVVG